MAMVWLHAPSAQCIFILGDAFGQGTTLDWGHVSLAGGTLSLDASTPCKVTGGNLMIWKLTQ